MSTSVLATTEMHELTDAELSEQTGQALLSLGYTNPSATGEGKNTSDYGFYKLGLEAKVELNANIKNLQLGCGGTNGAGACDIDMSNVSLSGLPDGRLADGTATWSKDRPSTSAEITNPFLEFAIKNPNSASTREVTGFRLSAEKIMGYLSAGTDNIANPTDGIKSFSGFIKVAKTPVNAFTKEAFFGTTEDQRIFAKITALGLFPTTVFTDASSMQSSTNGGSPWGIKVPSQKVQFDFPETIVSGNRMSQLNLVVQDVPIPTISIGADNGAIKMLLDEPISLLFGAIYADKATFYMGEKDTTSAGCAANRNTKNCSYIDNLKANVTVKQNFNLIHNLPITSGGYLSLQSEKIKWPGSDAADVAQPGFWLSFKDPLDFGALNPTSGIGMDDVLPQIATFITNYLSQNNIDLDLAKTFDAITGAPIYKGIGAITLADNARAVMTLSNLLLDSNQKPVSNCYGGLKFC
ncbi:hypothetical protein [Acinetobacter sp. WCHAc060025]|nr:hypothetical protein [Acinetobacter sp. WCHAc060025]